MASEEITHDQTIPFHIWDDVPYARAICLNVTLRFDEIFDHVKLNESLAQLFQDKDWRKLGSRVRQNKSGKLEYHLPVEFTNDRPGFVFTTAHHETPISSHPLASQMPSSQKTSEILILGRMSIFNSITRHPNTPSVLADYLSADVPQLFIHIVTFTDTTLLTITFPHTIFDAMSLSYFLKSWTSILAGQKDQVAPFLGFSEDIFAAKSTADYIPAEEHVCYQQTCSKWTLGLYALCREWEVFWYPQVEDRAIVIPHLYVQRLREKALEEIQSTSTDPRESPFVSEGDIILAWMCKALGIAMDASPSTPVCISNVFDARAILGISQQGAYIGNGTMPCWTILKAGDLQEDSVSALALRVRRSLLDQRDKAQVCAMDSMRRKAVKETGFLPLVGDPHQIPMMCTNWYRARLFDLDFAGARVDGGLKSSERPCRPKYINNAGPDPLGPRSVRNFFTVLGKDGDGNWWFQVIARGKSWEKIEKTLRGLAVDIV
ncbi:hypothetical protein POX_f08060 [Penicillium oxalicum]|uniref:hypothetical protein n=1 Tax=Penicillium oxalicum TaxID=69781 RepID=UPI0020B6CE5E|nr:hypothetical protein POX_f08060 [Penicillium oxalicum]KAI2787685.1 hypothetical protein POX_f08060 [Penicillium oxalicum]